MYSTFLQQKALFILKFNRDNNYLLSTIGPNSTSLKV